MDDILTNLLNPAVGLYLLIVLGLQIYLHWIEHRRLQKIERQRHHQGLTGPILMNHAEHLIDRRRVALRESTLLILSVILVPFLLLGLLHLWNFLVGIMRPRDIFYFQTINLRAIDINTASKGLGVTFATLILWILISGTDMAKAFFGGLAFKTLLAYRNPFQVGDRVTLRGMSGKVIRLDTFFVQLQTSNDDLISIPTASLWSEVLSSTNGGDRSSLCVMNFYLASFVTQKQRQAVEDTIWNAIQSSVYYEPSKPMQIYLSQTPDAIQLTAKAYVASTYKEALFVSDVTRAVLDITSQAGIVLAPAGWEASASV